MNKEILYLLDFPHSDEVLHGMSEDAIDILLNIEIIVKNKFNLDKVYHEPDNFLIECNNIIRNLVFLVEKSLKLKSKYPWLYKFIKSYRNENTRTYSILKRLRDVSMHQEFIITEGAIDFGLYRITNSYEYKLKIGMGDLGGKNRVSKYYVYRNTDRIFQSLLMWHYIMFMDLEHSAIGECLGISRFWKVQVEYKDQELTVKKETVDVYDLINQTVSTLLNGIIKSYCDLKLQKFKPFRFNDYGQYNFINTILEVDLYPDWFKDLWDTDIAPLNWKYDLERVMIEETKSRNYNMKKLYGSVPKSKDELKQLLLRYSTIKINKFKNQDDFDLYIGLILFPHFYITHHNVNDLINRISFVKLNELQRAGERFVEKVNNHFEEISDEIKNKSLRAMNTHINELYSSLFGETK